VTTAHEKPRACARCGGEVEEGYLLDEGYGARYQARFVAGEVRYGWLGGVKPGDQRKYKVVAWRCTRCGALDLFARQRDA
jgi:hypothetical protein